MAHELRQREAMLSDARRILGEQVEEALHALDGKPVSDKKIHDSRKAIKKARATLRLIRKGITAPAYRRENATLRDAARPLSAVRDARILLDSLDRLEKLYGPPATQSIPAALRRALQAEQREIRSNSASSRATLTKSRQRLTAAHQRISRLTLRNDSWATLEKSLRRTYRQARATMKAARSDPTPEKLHEWRKQAKYLWHQLQMLEPLWPGLIGELADQTHKLADYLGDDHDLAVLRAKAVEQGGLFAGPGGPGPLLALIDRCRKQLQAKAFVLGSRLLDEKPAGFAARFRRHWRQWRAEKASPKDL
jgi:CHAD domain-containing protein